MFGFWCCFVFFCVFFICCYPVKSFKIDHVHGLIKSEVFMQKWEYMLVGVVKSYGMNYRANGEKVGDWDAS